MQPIFRIGLATTPVGVNNTEWVDCVGQIYQIRFSVGVTSVASVTVLPNNAIVVYAAFDVQTAYPTASCLSLGQAGSPTLLLGSEIDATVVGLQDALQDTTTSPLSILATVSNSPVTGAAIVIVNYTVPLS